MYAHAGAVRQFVNFARSTGLPLDRILDDELRAIANASAIEERVPAHAIVDMLQVSSVVANLPELGVAFACWGNMRGWSPLSLLWDHCPNLSEALRVNARYIHIETAALGSQTDVEGDEIAIRQFLLIPARYGGSQFIQGTLTLEMRLARMLLGENWRPLRLELDCPPPADSRYTRSLFGCPIEYRADRNALIVRRSDMFEPAPNGNAHMLDYLERHMADVDRMLPEDLKHRVEQIVGANLASGRAEIDHVASMLAMSRRTLQRRLARENLSFADILASTRERVTREYFLTEKRPSLVDLAYRLGYRDTTAASRYLRQRHGGGARELALRYAAQSA